MLLVHIWEEDKTVLAGSPNCSTTGFQGFPEAEFMEADSRSRHFSVSSKKHQDAPGSRFDLYMGFEEVDGEENDHRLEFPCPFCSEDFDIVGLCCHVDQEHLMEAGNGVCPICEASVSIDIVGHITMQHQNFFRMQHRKRSYKDSSGSSSSLAYLKELRDGHVQPFLGGSSYHFSSNVAPNPLLISFISSIPVAAPLQDALSHTLYGTSGNSKLLDNNVREKVELSLSDKDLEEKSLRSKFMQVLVLSTVLGA